VCHFAAFFISTFVGGLCSCPFAFRDELLLPGGLCPKGAARDAIRSDG